MITEGTTLMHPLEPPEAYVRPNMIHQLQARALQASKGRCRLPSLHHPLIFSHIVPLGSFPNHPVSWAH